MGARRDRDGAGSYASWLAGDNLAPASMTSALSGAGGRRAGAGVAANGGSATLAMRKFGAALKVRPATDSRLRVSDSWLWQMYRRQSRAHAIRGWGLSYSRDVAADVACGRRCRKYLSSKR